MRKHLSQEQIRKLLARQPLSDVCAALVCYFMARTQFHNPPGDVLAVFRGFTRLIKEVARHLGEQHRFEIGNLLRDAADTIERGEHPKNENQVTFGAVVGPKG
jgi:hypothetical protein